MSPHAELRAALLGKLRGHTATHARRLIGAILLVGALALLGHPSAVADVTAVLMAAVAGVIIGLAGSSSSSSLALRRTARDGQVRWLHEDVTLAPRGEGRWHAFGVVTDVTEAKRVEAALRQSEQRFALFMDNLPGPAFIKDAQGRMVYLNRAAQISTPQDLRQHWQGKTARDVYPVEVADVLEAHDRQV